MKLYEISQQIEDLWQVVAEAVDSTTITAPNGDVLTADQALLRIESVLAKAEGTHAQKCLDIGCFIKDLDAEAEAIRAEEKRLAARRKTAESKASWLRQYLEKNMEPGTNLKDPRTVISWRKSQAVDVLVPADQLPEKFRRTKVIVEADRTALKDALKAGDSPDLDNKAVLCDRHNIQIR
jgi:malate synthase